MDNLKKYAVIAVVALIAIAIYRKFAPVKVRQALGV